MKMSKSPWLLHYDGSSCNGCDIEVLAATTPVYDVERFGVINTGNPKHADIFLITGGINEQNKSVVKQLYDQMPDPKVVVAVGICACDGGIFKECYNILGGVDKVIPVDIYVPGCAARPEAIIDGVVKAVALLDKKREQMNAAEVRRREGLNMQEINPVNIEVRAIEKQNVLSETSHAEKRRLPSGADVQHESGRRL